MPDPCTVRILVVDDNEVKRYSVVRTLRQAGFETLEAATGAQALEQVQEQPDLVVLDVKLPDISGFEVCQRIKSDPDLASTKVLHVSATFVDSDHRVEGLAHGADGYLVQPLDPSELVETVRALLRLREAEEASRRTAREWRATFDALRDGVMLIDEWGTVLRCNRAMIGILHKRFHEIIGLSYLDAFEGVIDLAHVPPLQMNGPVHTSNSAEIICGDHQFLVTVSPVLTERDKPAGAVCVFSDITERNRMEAELLCRADALAQADQAKDEFLAMLAHELRNPLGAISNAVELLQMRAGEAPALRKPLDILKRQLRHTGRLVDDLLDISRITRGKLELRRERVDVVLVARRAMDAGMPFETAGHKMHASFPPGPLWVDGDPARLEQVLGNLLNNACKYTPTGGRVEMNVSREGDEAVIRVKDNGQGISPEMLPRIFELFAQEDRSLDRSKGGLGIGLTLVKRLVEMHGGRVAAASDGPGTGSEFTVRLPLLEARPDAADADGEAGAEASAPLRILVVEDNADSAAMLADIFEAWGHSVQIASNGQEALSAAQEGIPEVVFLDIGLPGMDGYEVGQKLKEMNPASPPTLVALTGYGQDEDRHRTREAGFAFHLVKPVAMEDLQKVLSTRTPRDL